MKKFAIPVVQNIFGYVEIDAVDEEPALNIFDHRIKNNLPVDFHPAHDSDSRLYHDGEDVVIFDKNLHVGR